MNDVARDNGREAAPEAVAWQWRFIVDEETGEPGEWATCLRDHFDFLSEDFYAREIETRELYALAPQADQRQEVLQELTTPAPPAQGGYTELLRRIDHMQETYRYAGPLANDLEDAKAAAFVDGLEWVRKQIAAIAPPEPAQELHAAANALYAAGRWDCASIPLAEQAKLWESLRDALGLPTGTATKIGVASLAPSEPAAPAPVTGAIDDAEAAQRVDATPQATPAAVDGAWQSAVDTAASLHVIDDDEHEWIIRKAGELIAAQGASKP